MAKARARRYNLLFQLAHFDEVLTEDETIEVAVQVNGKVRGRIVVPRRMSEGEAIAAVLTHERVRAALAGKSIRRQYIGARTLGRPSDLKRAPIQSLRRQSCQLRAGRKSVSDTTLICFLIAGRSRMWQ